MTKTDWMTWDILVDYGNKTILNRSADKDVFLRQQYYVKKN